MLTTIPFQGFYCSIHEGELDRTLGQMFSDRESGCRRNEGLEARVHEKCDWGLVFANYAAAYAAAMADEFKIAMTFESLKSQSEYNFTTDVIYCHIELDEVKRIRAETNEKDFRDKIRQRFTSCDGFHSFYSNDLDDWDEIETWDHNEVGTLIEAYVEQESEANRSDGFDQSAELYLMERASTNGDFDTWISSATPGIERFHKIHDYLEDRKERAA